MNARNALRRKDGVALVLALFIIIAITALASAAVVVSGNAVLISMQEERMDNMEYFAEAGLENARWRMNADPTLYSDTNVATLENGVALAGGGGQALAGWRRYTYAGPYGEASGEYGVHGTVVSVVESSNGTRVVRRMDVFQESFSKYAWFTDVEGNIYFGGGDRIAGAVHSNDQIKIHSTGASFLGPGKVTTASTISGANYGTFSEGYSIGVGRIELPGVADLGRLRGFAQAGRSAFVTPNGNPGETRLRIEFVGIDLNGDGNTTGDNEGFFRVYETQNLPHYSVGKHDASANFYTLGMENAEICGYHNGVQFVTPLDVAGNNETRLNATVRRPDARCYLAGDPRLYPDQRIPADGEWRPRGVGPVQGAWRARGWALAGSVPAVLAGRSDYAFLFPLSKAFNPEFKGVIHVTGPVAVSGDVRGRVTLAATGDILLVDDLRYARGPATADCSDIVGLFSGGNITVVNNSLSTPVIPRGGNNAYNTAFTYDESSTEYIHAFVLTLGSFGAEAYGAGPVTGQPCGASNWGRGCLELAGGVIQRTRGAVGDAGGHGYVKRYSYDVCGARKSPPYFPTTGHFARATVFELDPARWTTPSAFYGPWLND
jgi:hypothetical protein